MHEEKILIALMEILKLENRPMSIRELTLELEKKGYKKSPQIVLKLLKKLEEKGDIKEE